MEKLKLIFFSPKLTRKLFPGVKMMLAIGYVFEYSSESALITNSLENQFLNKH